MTLLHPPHHIRLTSILGRADALSCSCLASPSSQAEAFLLRWCPSGLSEFGLRHQHDAAAGSRFWSGVMYWIQAVLEAPELCCFEVSRLRKRRRRLVSGVDKRRRVIFCRRTQLTSVCGFASLPLRVPFLFPTPPAAGFLQTLPVS